MTRSSAILAPYQLRWVNDPNPRKVAVKSRRIGLTFCTAYEEVSRALGIVSDERGRIVDYRPEAGVDQYVISSSHRQSIAHLAQCAAHVEAFNRSLPFAISDTIARTCIRLANGKAIYALPPNPRTIRGDGGDVTIDEAGVTANSLDVFKAASPIAGAHIGRPDGYRIRVVGSPCGDDADNLLYRLYQTDAGENWARHRISIFDAVREGFPANPAAVRAECIDDDEFEQEYNCAFLSAVGRYISAELWDSCVAYEQPEGLNRAPGFAGYDVARRPSGDLAALVEVAKLQGQLYHLSTWAERGLDWDSQERLIGEVLERRDSVAIDTTGIGMQFGERLRSRYGYRVISVEFTSKTKEELITGLKLALEKKRLQALPDGDLRRDVLSIRREVTKFGNVRYEAKRTDRGHADRAWALALAVHASGGVVQEYNASARMYESVRKRVFGIGSGGLAGW